MSNKYAAVGDGMPSTPDPYGSHDDVASRAQSLLDAGKITEAERDEMLASFTSAEAAFEAAAGPDPGGFLASARRLADAGKITHAEMQDMIASHTAALAAEQALKSGGSALAALTRRSHPTGSCSARRGTGASERLVASEAVRKASAAAGRRSKPLPDIEINVAGRQNVSRGGLFLLIGAIGARKQWAYLVEASRTADGQQSRALRTLSHFRSLRSSVLAAARRELDRAKRRPSPPSASMDASAAAALTVAAALPPPPRGDGEDVSYALERWLERIAAINVGAVRAPLLGFLGLDRVDRRSGGHPR
jgi:hypothetical protein